MSSIGKVSWEGEKGEKEVRRKGCGDSAGSNKERNKKKKKHGKIIGMLASLRAAQQIPTKRKSAPRARGKENHENFLRRGKGYCED